jgi:hypothetical protein
MGISMKLKSIIAASAAGALLATSPAFARWADWPPGPTDAELEQVVRVAYTAAADYARKNTNYFSRDGVVDPLRSAIEDELGRQGLTFVEVAGKPSDDLDAARACAADGTELRFAVSMFGDAISLAAATDKRVFSYHYDPHEDAAIVVKPSEACAK